MMRRRWHSRWTLPLTTLLLGACDTPDPAAEDPFQQLAQAPQSSGGAPAAGAPGDGGAPPAGAPGEGGQPGGGLGPPGAQGEQAPASLEGMVQGPRVAGAPTPDPSKFVIVSGQVTAGTWAKPLQIDFLELDHPGTEGRPRLTVLRIPTPGPFEVVLPRDAGKVGVNVYLDAAGDGPADGDLMLPWGSGPLQVGTTDLKGVNIQVDAAAPPPTSGPEGGGQPPAGEVPAAPPAPDAAPAPGAPDAAGAAPAAAPGTTTAAAPGSTAAAAPGTTAAAAPAPSTSSAAPLGPAPAAAPTPTPKKEP